MKKRSRLKAPSRVLNWFSNLTVGLVVGGLLGILLAGNANGYPVIFAGMFTAALIFDLFEEEDQ